jgi:cellobiose epimerase
LNRIIDRKTNHLRLFFSEKWTVKSDNLSFGHDIETSWLLTEASETLNKDHPKHDISGLAVDMAQAVHDQGMDADGGILFEADRNGRIIDSKKEWWVQCEGVLGFLNAYRLSCQSHFVDSALKTWGVIEKYIIDREHGEWVRYVTRDRVVKRNEALVNNWKCPYHNSRLCLEIINRVPSME